MSGLIIIALVLLLLYGSDRLATIGKGLGEGVKAFRKTLRQGEPVPPVRKVEVVLAPPSPPEQAAAPVPPKLLPAKGQTSRTEPPPDPEGS